VTVPVKPQERQITRVHGLGNPRPVRSSIAKRALTFTMHHTQVAVPIGTVFNFDFPIQISTPTSRESYSAVIFLKKKTKKLKIQVLLFFEVSISSFPFIYYRYGTHVMYVFLLLRVFIHDFIEKMAWYIFSRFCILFPGIIIFRIWGLLLKNETIYGEERDTFRGIKNIKYS
jgi:hypothetical protein